jgi:DNA-binding XRE family transcriptional regulator
MVMHAYHKDYVINAQQNLGNMMDYAVNTCDLDADKYFGMFIISGIAEQFGKGNPKYIAGKTGCELVLEVYRKIGLDLPVPQEEMYLDKSPEYWAGWAIAYYQWYTGKSFANIYKAVTMDVILGMYHTLHEADITKFVGIMEEKITSFYGDSKLKQIRENAGLTQRELAEITGVSIRQIQLFEQGQRDINKTQVLNVAKLARGLGCSMEDLLEL